MQEPQEQLLSTDEKAIFLSALTNQFRVDSELGSGGMSTVFKCTDLAVQRTVAIKCLQPALAHQPKWLLRFQQEAKAIGRLSHPNIVRVHHFACESGAPYIVMDYVEGTSLADILAQEGALEIKRTVHLITEVMDALVHAHSHHVIHRDLKPSNIMIVNPAVFDERVKILDFGIAKIDEESNDHRLTKTGEIFGSPLYMSPEQCEGKKSDERSDQYSCGCMLFECLTGYPPFIGETAMSILVKQINSAPPSLSEASLGKKFPAALEAVVARMLQKNPEERFATMADAKSGLTHALTNPAVVGVAGSAQRETTTQVPRAAIVVGLLALIAVLMTAVMATIFWPTPMAPVSQASIMEQVNDDYGDGGVKQYLDQKDHFLEGRFDASKGGHSFLNMTDLHLPDVATMPNLVVAQLSCCGNITTEGLAALLRAPRLRELHIDGTHLRDDAAAVIARSHIHSLEISTCEITNAGLKDLAALPLTELTMRTMPKLSPGWCEVIANCKTLRYLVLAQDQYIDTKALSQLSELETLDLGSTSIEDKDLEPLTKLTKLRNLLLGSTYITNRGLATLEQIPTLARLDIDHLKLSDNALRGLNRLKSLRYIYVGVPGMSAQRISEIKAMFPHCEVATP